MRCSLCVIAASNTLPGKLAKTVSEISLRSNIQSTGRGYAWPAYSCFGSRLVKKNVLTISEKRSLRYTVIALVGPSNLQSAISALKEMHALFTRLKYRYSLFNPAAAIFIPTLYSRAVEHQLQPLRHLV